MSEWDPRAPHTGALVASVACGHVYFDNGEDPVDAGDTPTPAEHSLLTIAAAATKDDAGRVVGEALVLHGEAVGGMPTACAPAVALPPLGGLRVVGLPTVAPPGLDVQVVLHKVVVASASDSSVAPAVSMLAEQVLPAEVVLSTVRSMQVPQEAVWYDAEVGTLRVEGLDEEMQCPEGWLVTWSVASMDTSVE